MKKLTAIRLINWHAFQDELIHINNSVLLTGENGAGKSTILDAIQFVLTCSKSNFNKAANENSKRNLIGYVRYKTGKEDKEYERKDNISSHVALEFYEELKNNYFIIGAVIDSSSITSDPKVLWYRIEKKRLEDIEYINKVNDPLDISSFKTYIKELTAKTFNRNGDAKNDFKNRLGRLNDKFFELLPKSLAFKPLSNVKDFVYSYILEERELSIDTLRENIRTYKSFEELLNETKTQIEKLKEIKNIYEQYEGAEKNIKLHEYLALKAKDEITEEEIKRIKSYINKYDEKIKDLDRDINITENELQSCDSKISDYTAELKGNPEYKLLTNLSNDLQRANRERVDKKDRYDKFNCLLKVQSKSLKKLYEVSKNKIEIQKLYNIIQEINENNLDEFKDINLELEEKIKNEEDTLRNENASKKHKIDELEEEQKKLEGVIKNLENRKLNYPYGVEELRDEIKSEMKKLGKDVTPKILCELIDVVDPEWKNAVEGYLNTQRFYLLVDEEYFDDSLRIYERKSKVKNIYSTGLVNLAGLEKYSECDENSLAQVVTSKSEGAKRYINMILGRVIRCNKVDELKKYSISITKTCMTYQNNVAKKINPKIYEKPYIGEEAYKKQLEIAKEKLEKIKSELNTLRSEVRENNNILSLISSLKLEKLREDSYIIKDFVLINLEIEKLKKEIKDLEKNDSFMAIQLKIEELNKQKEEIYNKKNKLSKQQRDLLVKKDTQEVILKNKEKEKTINTKSIQEKINEFGSIAIEGKARYENERKEKSAETILANFSISKEKNLTIKRNLEIKLNESQREYNNEYDLGAEVSINGMETFLAELDKLEKSKIVEYDEKVKKAKKDAEEEFKEHFIARIQENILNAKKEFKELNKELKDIPFGEEKYEFKIGKGKENKEYYDMIMDEENIGEGFTLFSTSYESKHKELLNELFDK
ncbi:MAG: ATP-binding protein, partial [Clostridium sp.]|nr:ATP-binding protein [Clostridium sp.]